MYLQQIELLNGLPAKKSISLVSYECREVHDHGGGGGGHPRCLAALPSNIEELINQFKMQENRVSLNNQTYIK